MRGICMGFVAGVSLTVAGVIPAQTLPTPTESSRFVATVREHFAAWDENGDDRLDANEIEQAVHDPNVTGPTAAAAVALRRAVRARNLPPLSLADLERPDANSQNGERSPVAFDDLFEAAVRRITAARRELFVSDTPKLDSLGQGYLGDCFLLAGLGTVAQNDPQRLVGMLRSRQDGKIDVHFATGRVVTIDVPTDGEIGIGASTRNDGLWAITFEKAAGTLWLERQQFDRQRTPRHVTPLSLIGVGGSPHTMLELLTGHRIVRAGCEDFQNSGLEETSRTRKLDDLRQKLIDTQDADRMMVGGTGPIGAQAIVPGLYYNHSYGVLRYDRATDQVTFWNPLGNAFTPKGPPGLEHGYATRYGRFEVPLDEAVMWFGSFSLETNEPPPP